MVTSKPLQGKAGLAKECKQYASNMAYQQKVKALGDGESTISLLATSIAVLQLSSLVKSSGKLIIDNCSQGGHVTRSGCTTTGVSRLYGASNSA